MRKGVMDDLEEIKAKSNTAVCVFDQSTENGMVGIDEKLRI
ncbi:MAG: hypothetical protein R2769_05940 [Saprospiraceae bacterium]